MLSIVHPASRIQIHDFYDTFGTVMDIVGRIGLVRASYMPDKPNLIYDCVKEKYNQVFYNLHCGVINRVDHTTISLGNE